MDNLNAVTLETKDSRRRRQRWPRYDFWHSKVSRRPYETKMNLIREPWIFPMSALNLAAVQIQRTWRGVFIRSRLRSLGASVGILKAVQRIRGLTWRPHWRRTWSKSSGKLFLKYKAWKHRANSEYAQKMEEGEEEGGLVFAEDPEANSWLCTRLQAWWRMIATRREYNLSRFSIYHIAAMQIQYLWRFYYQSRFIGMMAQSPQESAVRKIQNLWRRYTNRRIFFYYRDLIKFRNAGDPALMLRCINPREASLLDSAAGVHIRFRLGGSSFPPVILYKVYTHKPLCDVNAFAPRDYSVSKSKGAKYENNHSNSGKQKNKRWRTSSNYLQVGNARFETKYGDSYDDDDGSWYQRNDMNNWRPVAAGVLQEADMLPEQRNLKSLRKRFHYSRQVRKQDKVASQKRKKRQWMMKLYKEGLASNKDFPQGKKKTTKTIFRRRKQDNWEEQAEELLEWSSALDFDEYLQEWTGLGTSGPSNQAHYEKSVLVDSAMSGVSGMGGSNAPIRLGQNEAEILLGDEDF